jgi:hypothetical protein
MSKSHKIVTACIQIKLRDWGAFEDLAHELGYDLSLKELEVIAPQKVKKGGGRHYPVTPDLIAEVKRLASKHPDLPIKQIHAKCKYDTSHTTVGRIMQGLYD